MQLNLIDIGSSEGLGIPWRDNRDVGHVLSFEPNEPQHVDGLRISYPTAVWNYDGEGRFTVYCEGGWGSSLLKQNVDWVRENFETIRNQGNRELNDTWFDRAIPRGDFTCTVRRLDTVLADLPNRPRYHFLKSDTQSGEWFVLDGARQFLKDECLGAELECFRYPLYAGLRKEDEVIKLMDELGFDPWGWTGYQNSFLSQADRLFIRRDVSAADVPLVNAIKAAYGVARQDDIIKPKPKRRSIARRFISRVSGWSGRG